MPPVPSVFVPGLACSPRLYAEQLAAAWRHGPVTVADHTRDDTIASIARRILSTAPPRFALVGLSMGGYVAFEVLRQAPERVSRVLLFDTSARPDAPEQTARRREQIEMAESGRYREVIAQLFPRLVHPAHVADDTLAALVQRMAEETGPEAFVRQQMAILARPDSRPTLAAIACPAWVVVGEGDQVTPPEVAREIVNGIRGARLELVEGAGHLSTLERPQATARLIEAWLSA